MTVLLLVCSERRLIPPQALTTRCYRGHNTLCGSQARFPWIHKVLPPYDGLPCTDTIPADRVPVFACSARVFHAQSGVARIAEEWLYEYYGSQGSNVKVVTVYPGSMYTDFARHTVPGKG